MVRFNNRLDQRMVQFNCLSPRFKASKVYSLVTFRLIYQRYLIISFINCLERTMVWFVSFGLLMSMRMLWFLVDRGRLLSTSAKTDEGGSPK